jgi:hypothetical protein
MKTPPSPSDRPTMLPRRPKQNLTTLAQGVSGAVLLPVPCPIRQPQLWHLVKEVLGLVKKVKNLIFTPTFSFRFTRVIGYRTRYNSLRTSDNKKCAVENDPKRAGATPLFGLPSAQKVFEVAPARFGGQTRHAAGQKPQGPRMYRQRAAFYRMPI